MIFALKRMQYSNTPPRLVRLIGAVMSESKKFFTLYGQPELKRQNKFSSSQVGEEIWRDHLKIGDQVNVRVNSKVMQSEIVEMSPTETEAKLRVQSTGETIWLSTDSPLLSLLVNQDDEEVEDKKEQDEDLSQWRKDLKVGSLVDARDQIRTWYRGRVEYVQKDRLLVRSVCVRAHPFELNQSINLHTHTHRYNSWAGPHDSMIGFQSRVHVLLR